MAYGYALVHVTSEQFSVQVRGSFDKASLQSPSFLQQVRDWVSPSVSTTDDLVDELLYSINIVNEPAEEAKKPEVI